MHGVGGDLGRVVFPVDDLAGADPVVRRRRAEREIVSERLLGEPALAHAADENFGGDRRQEGVVGAVHQIGAGDGLFRPLIVGEPGELHQAAPVVDLPIGAAGDAVGLALAPAPLAIGSIVRAVSWKTVASA